jgi:hypothetical protein
VGATTALKAEVNILAVEAEATTVLAGAAHRRNVTSSEPPKKLLPRTAITLA